MTRREDFYDEEPWPGPGELRPWTFNMASLAPMIAALQAGQAHTDNWVLANRQMGESIHQAAWASSFAAEEAADKIKALNQAVSMASDRIGLVPVTPVTAKPPHSMTQRMGFRRGRKTT